MPLDLVIDRRSPIPLYYQLASQIEQAIADGSLAPGERIDTEVEIAKRFGLSRPTVRQAIAELVNKGLLVRRRGVGTQVVHAQVHRQVELTSLHDDLTKAGRGPSTTVLSFGVEKADSAIATTLGLAPADHVYHFERLRYGGAEPLAIMRNWVPVQVAELDETTLGERGLYDLLRGQGVRIAIAHQRIGAASATAAQGKLLGIGVHAPLLTLERTAFDDSGRAVEFSRTSYRADSYSFETTLVDR